MEVFNETTANSTLSTFTAEAAEQDTYSHYRCSRGVDYSNYIADGVITPPIVIFGVIGNILSFIVMCMQKPVLTTTVILRYLAVIDTLILLAAIPLRTLRSVQLCHGVMDWYDDVYKRYIFFYGMPSLFVLRMIGTWLTALLTVDRYIAICKPLQAKWRITLKSVCYQTIFITGCSILLSLPNYFEFHCSTEGERSVLGIRDFAKTREYVFIYKVLISFLILYIIPMVIMIIFNTNLVVGLRSAAKEARKLQRSVSSENGLLNTSIIAIVIGIVVTFIVCNTLALISHTLFSIIKCFPSLIPHIEIPRRYITQFSNIFVTINSAVNFLIYCVCSRSFRATFLRVFRCKNEDSINRTRKSRQSSGSANTNFSLFSGGSNNKSKSTKQEGTTNNETAILMYG